MRIGTVRPEEARVFDSASGYHRFHSMEGDAYGSFEVFWGSPTMELVDGWYWWVCFPCCLPDGEPIGPFASSSAAMYDADEYHPDNKED